MKLINNSIDSEYLQDSISDADLGKQLANFKMETRLLNGHHSEGMKISEKNTKEGIEVAKLSNGVHGKAESPIKCNGKENGFSEEDDFNLVLEDSSEGGESPMKKIEDDSMSAPQIVQQIEDILGINSSSAGIQEELKNLDGLETIEDNLDNEEDITESQDEIEEFDGGRVEENKLIDSKQIKNTQEVKKLSEKDIETTECDMSSNMNVVFDEVEVGMEAGDLSTANESNLSNKPDKIDCNSKGISETKNLEKLKDINLCETKVINSQNTKAENSENPNNLFEIKTNEISLTQTSSTSGNSEEWLVLDAIETSDDEKLSENQESSIVGNVENKQLRLQNMEDLTVETKLPVSTTDDNETSKDVVKAKEKSETMSITCSSLPLSEGDGVRKRCASGDEEEFELKKPKLDQNRAVESSSPVLKRPLPISIENESKRTKVNETTDECNTLSDEDSKVKYNSEETKEKIKSTTLKDDRKSDVPVQSSDVGSPLIDNEEKKDKINPIPSRSPGSVITTFGNDGVKLSNETEVSEDKFIPDAFVQKDNDENIQNVSSFQESSSLTETCEKNIKADDTLSVTTSKQSSEKIVVDNQTSDCEESKMETEEVENQLSEEKIVSDENKENVSSSSVPATKEQAVFVIEDLPTTNKNPTEPDQYKNIVSVSTKAEKKLTELSKQVSNNKELSSSIKELEKSIIKSGQEKGQSLKCSETKKITNLDIAIERVVEKARIQTEKKVPILKKFHKDQLKKLTRSDLEDIVVSKICEAVTYKSEIGQMRLRTQALEESNENWRKKVHQIEKQNRELEMVLKRFLAELSHIKKENQNKVPMPIKVTRSVGLQVVLASSMHGALVTSRSKINAEPTNQQQQQQQQVAAKVKQTEKEKVKDTVKATTFIPPNNSALMRGRGRPPKTSPMQNSRPTTPLKVTPPTTPVKITNTTPVKTISTPNKDLEVIDLTDKEERAKSTQVTQPQPPVSGTIRVAPSTQVCFVQQSSAPTPPQQPVYLVQKAGQRPQFLVATSSASPQRPMSSVSRPPPALALPVFRAGGHLIPVPTNQQVGVKTNTKTTPPSAVRQVASSTRLQPQAPVNKHPAPLPPAPSSVSKPTWKTPPPKPQLKIAKTSNGIMLSWSMSLTENLAEMQGYQLYAYQEGNQPPSTGLWKKVGDVKALPLPMACTLTQFIEGHKYHFAVRAVDVHGRVGPFSTPSSILLTK